MKKYFLLILFMAFTVFSCQKKLICPAYQSAFYLDKEKTEDFFSLFGEDSIPKSDFYVNKNKYGIIVKVKYRQKQRSLKTVKMKTVYPPAEDSLLLADNNMAEMDSSSVDSLFNDSYKDKFKFNRDQKLYMLAMDPYFDYEDPDNPEVDPDPDATTEEEEEVVEEKKKNSWWPFGKKNKKKDKEPDEENPDEDETETTEEENQ